MENRSRSKVHLGKAREFLQSVIVEHGAATKELKASNYELERLLEEVLSTRAELRPLIVQDEERVESPPQEQAPPDVRVAELWREAERLVEQGAAAIAESKRLRRRSQRIRTALEGSGPAKPAQAAGPRLSKREREVLSLMVAGKSSKEIAADLSISFKTAVTHRASIMSKLDVHEIASVVREAIRRGLV
jgi:DNA-binding CsgD family transcriptional regulator